MRVYAEADQPTQDALDLMGRLALNPGAVLRLRCEDIRIEAARPDAPPGWDGRALYLCQDHATRQRRVYIVGELAQVIDRILARKRDLGNVGGALVVNEAGQPLTASALDGRFGKAREKAGVKPDDFQMRDIRPKAATETDAARNRDAATALLGRTAPPAIRHRHGELVLPAP